MSQYLVEVIETTTGKKIIWRSGGEISRKDGPAIEEYIGGEVCRSYYRLGTLHRDEEAGPAIEFANGDKHYYHYGKLHRVGGPAIDNADGSKSYFKHGERHREDGPAVTGGRNKDAYYYEGEEYTAKGLMAKVASVKGVEAWIELQEQLDEANRKLAEIEKVCDFYRLKSIERDPSNSQNPVGFDFDSGWVDCAEAFCDDIIRVIDPYATRG